MQERVPNQDRTIVVIGAVLAVLWISVCIAYDAGYFGARLFELPREDLLWLAAWIIVPVGLIAACAALIQTAGESPGKPSGGSSGGAGKR